MASTLPAAIGSALFFILAPGTVAGLIPYWLTKWQSHNWYAATIPARILGLTLAACGLAVVIHSFHRFVVEGRGTPAPIAPPTTLVVNGFYRYVRNPMYVAVLMLIIGQGLLLGRFILVGYAAAVWGMTHLFVVFYEEPKLGRTFGLAYEQYRARVPRWLPKLNQ